jgi:L-threonylcarbamoyladenylate synthase
MLTRISTIPGALSEAATLLRAGNLVAFPTETVYGLGADARSDAAVQKIYDAKGRPSGNPIIVHIANTAAARAAAQFWPESASKLAETFWPGPLTLIVPRGAGISATVSAGRDTVALRVPSHPVAQALLREFNGPIAAPSANRSGFTSPTSAQHVLAELSGRIPLILDGGTCEVGLESTVLDVTSTPPKILRPGAITAEMLHAIIGPVETLHAVVREEDYAASPGQHSRHYAPRTPAFRISRADLARCGPNPARYAAMLASAGSKLILITHDPAITLPPPHETMLLPADPAAYAQKLYASLRAADELQMTAILILAPEHTHGLWSAIHDRLRRATRPYAPATP